MNADKRGLILFPRRFALPVETKADFFQAFDHFTVIESPQTGHDPTPAGIATVMRVPGSSATSLKPNFSPLSAR